MQTFISSTILLQLCIGSVLSYEFKAWSFETTKCSSTVGNAGNNKPPDDLCILPPELGYSGTLKSISECETLDYYRTRLGSPPVIGSPSTFRTSDEGPLTYLSSYLGSSVGLVCCPFNLDDGCDADSREDFCAKCPNKCSAVDSEESVYDINVVQKQVADTSICPNSCLRVNRCTIKDLENNTMRKCGRTKFCCKGEGGQRLRSRIQSPKFNNSNGEARPCQDHTPLCKGWHADHPESCRPSHPSYKFMSATCMDSCGSCRSKGCVDHYTECETWSRKGYCLKNPEFMIFYCRESCGTCGFKSPGNTEIQYANDGNGGRGQFSDINGDKFVCGKGKKKEDTSMSTNFKMGDGDLCTAVYINDRFALTAAHCLTIFNGGQAGITVRGDTNYQEIIGVKRAIGHVNFIAPKYEHDIALLELDRRIIFDYDKFGDSPPCLSNRVDVGGKDAIVQGVGITETQDLGRLLEASLKTLSTNECHDWIEHNVTQSRTLKRALQSHLPNGLTDDIVCTAGIIKLTYEDTFGDLQHLITAPCQGDSGGPLYINSRDDPDGYSQRTLAAIHAGGVSCGSRNLPSFWINIATHRSWILCTMEYSDLNEVDRWAKCGAQKAFVAGIRAHPCCKDRDYRHQHGMCFNVFNPKVRISSKEVFHECAIAVPASESVKKCVTMSQN